MNMARPHGYGKPGKSRKRYYYDVEEQKEYRQQKLQIQIIWQKLH